MYLTLQRLKISRICQPIRCRMCVWRETGGRNSTNTHFQSCLCVCVFFQRVTYEMKRPVHDQRAIAEVEGGVVKAGKEVEWKEQIIIPPLPQSSLVGCDIIKIEYYVKVRNERCLSLLHQQCFFLWLSFGESTLPHQLTASF